MSEMSAPDSLGIAIIGMVARFPGATDVNKFWQNLRGGVESISFFSEQELEARGVPLALRQDPKFVKAGAVIEGMELFDASFFDFSPAEAETTDPQHRLFLECAWEALENAGYDPEQFAGQIGVYAGAGMNTYLLFNLAPNLGVVNSIGGLQLAVGNDKDYLATRVSYKLNLKGPSINVQTACSTSLVAVSLACQSLLDYQCDLALAGGVKASVLQQTGYRHRDGDIASPDGHCRAFDVAAQGTVFGNGIGIVVLKRLEEALADGDTVYAVIKGSAVNNDGSLKIGYTAPSVDGQRAVIAEALAVSGVKAETISYVEAHGTGTPLGDPIEMTALKQAFGNGTARKNYCAVGSVKTNVGHLDTAAGVAGLIKTALALKHKLLPPSLHFERPNPQIDFADSPFYVNSRLTAWEAGPTPRRAGVSAFGFGGTNVHLVLEEAPAHAPSGASRPHQLLVLSAKTETALESATRRLSDFLRQHPEANLADVAFTLQLGRKAFAHRRALVCRDGGEAASALEACDPARVRSGATATSGGPVVFMFTGQGSQYVNMGRGLYETEPAFRRDVDECARLLEPALGLDLRRVLYPDAEHAAEAARQLHQTALAQPALFVTGYALAGLLRGWGISPKAMIGHSIGEYVAACLAGVMTLEDALSLVATRGRLMQGLPPGTMLAVGLPHGELEPLLGPTLSLAAVNSPSLCVASGESAAVEALEQTLTARGVSCRRLHTSHAFHSRMMEPILDEFARHLGGVQLKAPRLPYISNLTGDWIKSEEATDARYWLRHLRETVRFGEGIRLLLKDPHCILLEVGPGRTLGILATEQLGDASGQLVLPTLRQPLEEESDVAHLLKSLGRLWLSGVKVDWRGFHADEKRQRVPLPTYPFERQRYWIDPPATGAGVSALTADLSTGAWASTAFAEGTHRDAEAPSTETRETVATPVRTHRRPSLSSAYVAPRDEVERRVVGIWESYLRVGQVGVDDNFFEMGGHSLLATRLVALLRDAFAVELPLRSLFDSPTPALLALELTRLRDAAHDASGADAHDAHASSDADASDADSRGEAPRLPRIAHDPASRYDPFPLTDVQQAYWVGRSSSLELGGVATHVYFEVELPDLDLPRLEAAWRRVISRHDMLRAVIDHDGMQRVLEHVPDYQIEVDDLSDLGEEERARALAEVRARMSHQVLPADRWPLFEVRAARLGGGRVRLHVSFDMLIADAWSFQLLRRDVVRFYAEPGAEVEEVGVTFRDYVVAEGAWRETAEYERALAYWRGRAEGMAGAPELALARSPAAVGRPRFVRRVGRVGAGEWGRLKARGARSGLTPSCVLLGVYAEVLARWSRRQRFMINLTLFNRPEVHEGIGGVVGDFTSLTLLEVDYRAEGESFEARARGLQERLWEDLDHRQVSGVAVLRELARMRGGSRVAIPVVFTSELNFANPDEAVNGEQEEKAEEQTTGGLYSISQTPQVWLDHQVSEHKGVLFFNWDFVEELFPAGMMDEMFDAYLRRLRQLARDPDAWLDPAPPDLLPEPFRLALSDFNSTDAPAPDGLLHSPFLKQAALRPTHPALVSSTASLTYGELERLTARLAARLRRMGAGRNRLVAVVMRKGWEQAAGVLAVLRAGAAYLPLSAELPRERLWRLLEDGEVEVALTQAEVEAEVEWPEGVRRLCVRLDDEGGDEEIEGAEAEWLRAGEPWQRPEDLAYVIYTSGSTGMPKGVMIDHGAALNTVDDINARFGVGADDRVLALSSLSFDLSVYDIFGALGAGATVVFPEPRRHPDPAHWVEAVRRWGVTVWNSVPQLMEMSAEYAATAAGESGGETVADGAGVDGGALSSLRLVLVSGDWVPVGLARQVRRLAPGARVVSLGGATEAAIWSISYEVGERVGEGWRSVPYGRPLRNQRFYVLNGRGEECPRWVSGELHIGGMGLARGYWGDEGKTRERFVVGGRSGERMYRTGDVGRFGGEEWEVEFLGREDGQVKVGGHRVELGEVEAALGGHEWVGACVAAAAGGGVRRLVAYVVPKEGVTPEADELRSFLRGKLPEYMVPSSFVFLASLPLTSNGKVDRGALAEWEQAAPEMKDVFTAPRTPVEEMLASTWAEVLGLPQVGVSHNFFELGGESLLAMQVISRVRNHFNLEVPLGLLFESPTVAGFAERVEEALLAESGMQAHPLVRVPREGKLPLSFAQRRLWFLYELEPGGWAYTNLPLAVRLSGSFKLKAFEQALDEIVRRHENLRTNFVSEGGQPAALVSEASSMRVPLVDIGALPPQEREAGARSAARAEARRPFDLARDPLLRATVLRLDDEEHVVLLTLHHMVGDGWSLGILIREVATLYAAFSEGRPSPLAELPLQYADFAAWQSRWMQGEVLESQLAYWKQKLGGPLPVLELPADRPRPAVSSYTGASHSFRLPEPLADGLKRLSRSEGTTLFMTLLAAFQALLGRYTRSDDIIVGTDVAGRNRAETEGTIGFFVNQLVLRTDLSGDPGFRELLKRARATALGAYAHQDLPFEKLVEALNPERGLGLDSPIFQVRLLLQTPPQSEIELPGLVIRPMSFESGMERYDITLGLLEEAGALTGKIDYNADLFDAATIGRMEGHLRTLLESAVADPDRRFSELQLLTADEAQRLLVEWNGGREDGRPGECVHQMLEAQAERTPDAAALIFRDESLSYRELNERANRLAHHLRAIGVGPEVRVGLCVERSAEMVVGLLGILKAGGAYVPLDPAAPLERLSFIIEEAQLPLILAQERLVDVLPVSWAQVILIDSSWEELAAHGSDNPTHEALPENAAYVIYTSGSTGIPKGVVVEHRALCGSIRAQSRVLNVGPGDRLFQFAPFNFDASVSEIFLTLLSGATLYVPPRPSEMMGPDLLGLLREQAITVMGMPPSALSSLPVEELPALRSLTVAGEACPPEVVERWSRGRQFFNAYGPTEAAMIATVAECRDSRRSTVIGRPLANTAVYLLDAHLRPVPVGVAGELYIGGGGLARGYLSRAEQTAERFIPDPFSAEPGARLYRTGDLARYLADGNIDFVGRVDEQVKIRGYRIELGEIEAVLNEHPSIQQAKLVARAEPSGDTRLVAYIVPRKKRTLDLQPGQSYVAGAHAESLAGGSNGGGPPDDIALSAAALRSFAKEWLPDYMLPSAWVIMESLPLTPNGKVDVRALPPPEQSRLEAAEGYVAPRTHAEAVLAGIWAEVLNVERVGIHDDFFELGGHSLLATQVIARVREAFRIEVPLRAMFEAPTVGGFAGRVEAARRSAPSLPPPIQPASAGSELPLSFAQQRLWFLQQLDPDTTSYNFPSAIRLAGRLDVAALERTLTEIMRRHETLRTVFPAEGGLPSQVILPAGPLRLPVVDLSELPEAGREAAVESLIRADAQLPFDLARGPLLRAGLLRLGKAEHVALFTVHHIVGDGWSMDVLVREVVALYEAFTRGQPSPLPELPVQYKDYAVWQRAWLRGEVLESQLDYWRRHLGGNLPALELPLDRPRLAVPTYRGGSKSVRVGAELTTALRELGRREGVTLYMTLLGAFQSLLRRYSEHGDIIVGSPSGGRGHVELEGLIGFFVNTLAMRTDLSGNPSFREVLGRVREVVLGAQAHQDTPFEKLVEVLQPERSLSRTPLIQVWFVLMNAPTQEFKLPGLSIRPLSADTGRVKLDLGLSIAEEAKGLTAVFEYNTDLFDEATVAEMVGHYGVVLREVAARPERGILDIPLVEGARAESDGRRPGDTDEEGTEPDFSFN
jgi:amino acid adenylation domain-containing protein